MRIILLSGGSGKRLWPLSNDIRSKQFLKVVRKGDGETESMLQRLYRQIQKAGLGAEITIATSAAQAESIRRQLGENVSLVVEPERRNTFPTVALSVAYLYFEKNCLPDETVVVLPVDPYVGDEYFRMLRLLDAAVQASAADIVLMGVRPTYPSEKYGYIIPGEVVQGTLRGASSCSSDRIFRVAQFKEKPDVENAKEFIRQGGLWNCGVFAFRLSYMMNIVRNTVMCGCYGDVKCQYKDFEKTSFDYAVVEKSKSVAAIAYDGEWKDLGTWDTLTEVMEKKPIGDVEMSESCRNTHVVNELKIPVVVVGAKDMVVAASPDGILVSDKTQSSCIKKYVENRDMRPMYEERSWGEYTVLNISVDADGNRSVTKKKFIQAGKSIEGAQHPDQLEIWTILSGRAVISIKGRKHDALAGDTFTIERGVFHSLLAKEDTVLLEVQLEAEKDY